MDNFDEFLNLPSPSPEKIPAAEEFLGALRSQLPCVKRVWRLENKEGDGPYQDSKTALWQLEPHTPASGRPTPNADEGFRRAMQMGLGSYFDSDEFASRFLLGAWFDRFRRAVATDLPAFEVNFGFSSGKQLLSWFHNPEELIRLHKQGWRVVEKFVEGFDSGKQVIYLCRK